MANSRKKRGRPPKNKDILSKKKYEQPETKLDSEDDNSLLFIKLVNIVRKSKNKERSNEAFDKILELLKSKINRMSKKFKIPGCSDQDVYQESLYALRYKAIKDYDSKKSNISSISRFDTFAMLCIRRHLSTEYKSSHRNKSITLNKAQSIDQDRARSSRSEDNLFLSDIIQQKNSDVAKKVQDNEYFKNLMTKIYEKLSDFEKQVLKLYKCRYTYDEMIKILNKKNKKKDADVRSIDNALMRIKAKSLKVLKKIMKDEGMEDGEIDYSIKKMKRKRK